MPRQLIGTILLLFLLILNTGQGLGQNTPENQKTNPDENQSHDFHYRLAADSQVKVLSHNRLELVVGEIFVEAFKPTTIITPLGEVFLRSRSVVLFRLHQGTVRCLVLWDQGLGSVSVLCNKHRARLGPGDEAMITDHDPVYREIMEADEIGRRRVQIHVVGAGQCVTTSEFSLLQAIERHPFLQEIFHSPSSNDRALKEKILKTAAVLNMVTAGHGYYSTGARF